MNNEAFSSVLVVVNGERSDDGAVSLAGRLMMPSKGRLFILYVIEVERSLPLDAEVAPATAKGEEILRHSEEMVEGFKCFKQAELLQSRQAGSAIVQESVDKQVETIILGSSYNEMYGMFRMEETITYVLKNARCNVLIWRNPIHEMV